ncbi:uncharacterized protein LOC134239012 [Saccostrea cucullata]|uniref:uncharacterized protein LOC134239012 n=1 Tax=Saccostrea cuccullata TaxID=36930 RepID=UPI002ED20C75
MMSNFSVALIVVVITFHDGQCFSSGGTVYTRWGRTTCPPTATIIYSGYGGGTHRQHQGGAVEPLCLPTNPEWGWCHNNESDYSRGLVYGAEYQLFKDVIMPKAYLYNGEVPCVVCRTQNDKSVLVIPARKTCYEGWKVEYWGYLMSGKYRQPSSSTFTCMDAEPEALGRIGPGSGGYLFYPTEVRCGHLSCHTCSSSKCPPYKDGAELLCVICSEK